MIDLRSLETIANAEGGDVVVTRRWLKRVLQELREAREPVRPSPDPGAMFESARRAGKRLS